MRALPTRVGPSLPCTLALALASAALAAPPPCALPCSLQTGPGIPLATGDLNGDGRPDLVTLNGLGLGSVDAQIRFGLPGGLGATPDVVLALGGPTEFAFDMKAGDLNGDGIDDLVVAFREGVGRAHVVFGDAAWPATGALGSLPGRELAITGLPAISGAGLTGSVRVAVGDIDGDGLGDLAIALGRTTTVSGPPDRVEILRGPLAAGTRDLGAMPADVKVELQDMSLWAGGQIGRGFALADVNGDGPADLVMGTYGVHASVPGESVSVLLGGPGLGGVVDLISGLPDITLRSGASAWGLGLSIVATDVDADGSVDLVMGTTMDTTSDPTGDVRVAFGPLVPGHFDLDALPPLDKAILRGIDGRMAPTVRANLLPGAGDELYLRAFTDLRIRPEFAGSSVAVEPLPVRGDDVDVDAPAACSLPVAAVLSADFTGDGQLDLVTYSAATRQWELLAQGGGSGGPTLAIDSHPRRLWAPNHRMVEIALGSDVTFTTAAGCAPIASVKFTAAACDEPEDDRGDGHTAPDVLINDDFVWLRAERDGRGDGRTCTITLTATDAAGATASESFDVVIAHDNRDGGGVLRTTRGPVRRR